MSDRTFSNTPNNGDHSADHPTEWLPGYALGCLSEEELLVVRAHIAECKGCRDEVAAFLSTLDMLPFSVSAHEPPAHVKQHLLARIAATRTAEQFAAMSPATAGTTAAPVWRTPRWMTAALALCVVALLGLGAFSFQREQELATLRQELATNDTRMVSFVMASDAVTRALAPTRTGMDATMVMRPGHNQAALIIHGLPPLEPGKRYQFWFARGSTQVPAEVFEPAPDGSVTVMVQAPLPVEQYGEIMVTVEDADGSTIPSTDVIASASI